jgi:integrase
LPTPAAVLVQPTDDDIALVRSYLSAALSDNTLRAYKSDLKHFMDWGGQLPATPEQVATYLARHAETLSAATLDRRVVALTKAHETHGFPSPTRSALVKATLQGIRRRRGRPARQAAPLLKTDLVRAVRGLQGLRGLRDRALLLFGFAAALRRSELVSLDVSDLEFCAEGILICLRRSKTDQEGKGRIIAVPNVRGRVCPCRALIRWLSAAKITSGPVFRAVDQYGQVRSSRLTGQSVSLIVKGRVAHLGLDPSRYSGHSLRAGFVTSAAQVQVHPVQIRAQTGHHSDAMLQRYVRLTQMFSENANRSIW